MRRVMLTKEYGWSPAGMALAAALCVALLATAMPHDLFGVDGVRNSIVDLPRPGGAEATAAGAPRPSLPANIVLRAAGDPASATFAADLSSTLAGRADIRTAIEPVDGQIDVGADADGAVYGMTWSIGAGAAAIWCGRITATGQPRTEALLRFSQRIATALQRSTGDTPRCT